MATSHLQDKSLLLLILDITPSVWFHRSGLRNFQDQKYFPKSKGPAKLEEILQSVQSFLLAFAALHRENSLVVIGVAGDEVGVIFPRKGVGMDRMVNLDNKSGKIDPESLCICLTLGVAELVQRSSARVSRFKEEVELKISKQEDVSTLLKSDDGGGGSAITAATSLALCLINRFMVAANSGVSALKSENNNFQKNEDEGVLAMIAGNSSSGKKAHAKAAEAKLEQRLARGMLSPRILIMQASTDRTRDYNSFMNCAFAAKKGDIVIDGCFIPAKGGKESKETSAFLEQACDKTGGIFINPVAPLQINGAFLEVMMTVLLPPLSIRKYLNLPKLNEVDFRARCFETGESLEQGHVCNQCLSIFKNCPKKCCLTCGASIKKHNQVRTC